MVVHPPRTNIHCVFRNDQEWKEIVARGTPLCGRVHRAAEAVVDRSKVRAGVRKIPAKLSEPRGVVCKQIPHNGLCLG